VSAKLCASALLLLASCGYVGDPLPPALNIPKTVDDLRAVQRGHRVLIDFTIPERTTENLLMTRVAEVLLRAGERQFPVAAARPGPAEASVPVDGLVGQELAFVVQVRHPRGRWSAPSKPALVRVVHPVAPPSEVRAEDAPGGVRLHWRRDPRASAYRVFRLEAGEPREAARVEAAEWIDGDIELGRRYEYVVQALAAAGAGFAESEPSGIAAIVPEDRFPPAVPSGLTASPGIGTVELAWQRGADADLAGYHIYRATGDGPFARLTAEPAPAPAYRDAGVEPGRTYRYSVSSVDRKGNQSALSEAVSVVTPMI
jgi:hypothetical protein